MFMGNTFKKSKLFITVGSTDTFTNVGSIGLITTYMQSANSALNYPAVWITQPF